MFRKNLSILLFYFLKSVAAAPVEFNLGEGDTGPSKNTILGINRWVFIAAISFPFVCILFCLWCFCIGRSSAKNIERVKKERYILEHQQNTLLDHGNKRNSHGASDSSSITKKIISPHKEVEKEAKSLNSKKKKYYEREFEDEIEEETTVDLSSIKITGPDSFITSSPILKAKGKKTQTPLISPIIKEKAKKTETPFTSPIIKEKARKTESSMTSPIVKEKAKKSSSLSSSPTFSPIITAPRPNKINATAAVAAKMDSSIPISSNASVSSFETSSNASSTNSSGSKKKGGKKKGGKKKKGSSHTGEFYNVNAGSSLGMSPALNYNGVPTAMNPQAYYQQLYNSAAAQVAAMPNPYFSPYNQSPYFSPNGVNIASTLTNPYNTSPYLSTSTKSGKTNK